MKRKNLAFSMVEVMITLVILGVIAVLTVPGLVDSANKRINDAAAHKADYAVSQAAMRIQAECPRLRRCNDGRSVVENLADLLNKVNSNDMLTYHISAKKTYTIIENGHNKDVEFIHVFVTIKDDETFPILYEINNSGMGARPTSANVTTVLGRAMQAKWNGNGYTATYDTITKNGNAQNKYIRIDYNCKANYTSGVIVDNSCY